MSHSKEGVGLVSFSAPARLAWHPPLIYFQSAGFCSSLQSGVGLPSGASLTDPGVPLALGLQRSNLARTGQRPR